MIKKVTIGDVRMTFSIARIQKVVGVNSLLPTGKHFLMWDFDDVSLDIVSKELRHIQRTFSLPNITICNSGKVNHWLAYCFKQYDWIDAVRVIINTRLVDWNFLKYGMYRGKFTLRVSPKQSRSIKAVGILHSDIQPDCAIEGLQSWVRYETLK